MDFLDTEMAACVGQKMPGEEAQCDEVGDIVAFDDVSQKCDVNIGAEESCSLCRAESLSLGEAAITQIVDEGFFQS